MKHIIYQKDLQEGNIIPIFLSWNDQTKYRGDAVLIQRDTKNEPDDDTKRYEFKEIGSDLIKRKKEKVSIIYSYQIWIIKFVTGPDKGFQTKVKIAHYESTYYGKNRTSKDN